MSDQREPLTILVFSASLRTGSLNTRLARLVADAVARHGGAVDLGSMRDFDAPSYDGDLEDVDGMPPGPRALRERLEAADGFVIASPEYNGSMPGVLKNAIDWVSRARPQPFDERGGVEALPVRQARLGGVPRRTPRPGGRPRRHLSPTTLTRPEPASPAAAPGRGFDRSQDPWTPGAGASSTEVGEVPEGAMR